MFAWLSEVLLNQALRTTSAHLRREENAIIRIWLARLQSAMPSYRSELEDTERWGRENFALLLAALQVGSGVQQPEPLREHVLDMGRRVAIYHLERHFALEDILRAYSLFRLAVLNEIERMLRRRLWLAFPPDILKAEDRVNDALDLQMLAIAQSYLRTRDEEVARAQLALQESNNQLMLLIQEMHHRIKNNLQTVADLLSLEMLQGADTPAETRLRESITRIKSIAVVHELLSLDSTELTDIRRLAQLIVDTSARAMRDPQKDIALRVEGDAIQLPSKQATALALVMNELLNNALEHAFRGKDRGSIVVGVATQGDLVEVTVRDDGVGVPVTPDGQVQWREGLGLQIIRTMVTKDLAGTLEITPGAGTTATVRFRR